MLLNIKINNINIKVPQNFTILQICENLNIFIPRFCFHAKLSIAGNCRMCLIELKNSPKPVVACAMPVSTNMEIYTDTPLVKKTRENILEFLLINHPLDCPICDQAGECDLQEQTFFYGSEISRFKFKKRGVQNKNCGPFIKMIMTRCIHCTRCVRFATEVGGISELGTIGRGTHTEITTFIKSFIISELSGNVIDLCPVGALTAKPYAFKARAWEITKQNTIDCLDSLGSNIQVDILNNKILRVLPKKNPFLNDCWISDKIRFSYDANNAQRIVEPFIKQNDIFIKISWNQLFNIILNKFKKIDSKNILCFFDNFLDFDSIFLFKKIFTRLGISNLYNNIDINPNKLSNDFNINFLNTNIIKLKNTDFCLLIYCNLRTENTLLNLHLRNNYNLYKTNIYSIGSSIDTTYPIKHLGNNLNILLKILEGKHNLSKNLNKSKNPIIIIGQSLLKNKNSHVLYNYFIKYFKKINFLYTDISFYMFNEFNYNHSKSLKIKNNIRLTFFFNTHDNKNYILSKNSFNIYQGTHFNTIANKCDLIIPSLTPFEKNSNYVNNFGILQKTKKIIHTNLPKDTLLYLNILKYFKFNIKNNNTIYFLLPHINFNNLNIQHFGLPSKLNYILKLQTQPYIKNYYLNNSLIKPSKLMALKTQTLHNHFNNFNL